MSLEGTPLVGRRGANEQPVVGAAPIEGASTYFVVWAPFHERLTLEVLAADGGATRPFVLDRDEHGYHRVTVEDCGPGSRYRYRLPDGTTCADPASRSQPDGVHGPSEVVDLGAYAWGDAGFRAPALADVVISEVHVGTATEAGTLDALQDRLDDLVEVGVNAVELLPLAQFPGRWNWGYDGVFPFAVQDSYGGPHALQRFVDACHRRGLAVIADVVYNHLGPEGNVLPSFGPYVTDRYRTPWGPAMNFDGAGSDDVRSYFLQNARLWFEDFHVDALRLDAVHGIVDPTALPFLAELSALSRSLADELGRPCPLLAESADNNPAVVRPPSLGGLAMDAQWNDDFHHSLHTLLTGERTSYYVDFGSPDELVTAYTAGFVFQGQYSAFRRRRHGARPSGIDPSRFVVFAQNHDQIGNRPRGERLTELVDAERLRLAAVALLLAPGIPLLFMGEEYGETAPFPYFVDHSDPDLVAAVRRGRREELGSMAPEGDLLDPADEATRRLAVLDPGLRHRPGHRELWELHRRLLSLRRSHPALAATPHRVVAAHRWDTLVVLRRSVADAHVVALMNFGPDAVPVSPHALELDRDLTGARTLLDSPDPGLDAPGTSTHPDPTGGTLGPWGYRVLGLGSTTTEQGEDAAR